MFAPAWTAEGRRRQTDSGGVVSVVGLGAPKPTCRRCNKRLARAIQLPALGYSIRSMRARLSVTRPFPARTMRQRMPSACIPSPAPLHIGHGRRKARRNLCRQLFPVGVGCSCRGRGSGMHRPAIGGSRRLLLGRLVAPASSRAGRGPQLASAPRATTTNPS